MTRFERLVTAAILDWIPVYLDEVYRLALAAAALGLLYNKCLAIGTLAMVVWGIVALAALLPHWALARLPAAMVSRLQRWIRFKKRIAEANTISRNLVRFAFPVASALFVVAPMPSPPLPEGTKILLSDEKRKPYDGEMTSDGKYLFVTYAHNPSARGRGVARLDLDTGEHQFIQTKDEHGHFGLLLDDRNRLTVMSRLDRPGQQPEMYGYLYQYSIEPFELVSEQICEMPRILRMFTLPGNLLVGMTNVAPMGFVVLNNVEAPCTSVVGYTELSPHTRLPLTGLEMFTPLGDDPQTGWTSGWQGGAMCLIKPSTQEVIRCIWGGLLIWDAIVEPGKGRMWVSRHVLHKIDIRDSHSGALQNSIPVNGVVRALVIDPQDRYLYASLYSSKRIAVIDLDTDQVVNYVAAGFRTRRLFIDRPRRQLIAVSSDGVYFYPLDALRPTRQRLTESSSPNR